MKGPGICGEDSLVEGESINLSGAVPNSGWQISGWTGTNNNASSADTNSVTMLPSAHSASVLYKAYIYFPIIFGSSTTRPELSQFLSGEKDAINVFRPNPDLRDLDGNPLKSQIKQIRKIRA